MTLAFIALIGILTAGCATESERPSVSTLATSPALSPVPPPTNSNTDDTTFTTETTSTDDTTSEILQSGIPLKVTEPADAAEINTASIVVKGQTVPGAAVSVNDTAGIADSEGNFTIAISLEPGPNAVDVIATDDSGKQGEVLILVNVVS